MTPEVKRLMAEEEAILRRAYASDPKHDVSHVLSELDAVRTEREAALQKVEELHAMTDVASDEIDMLRRETSRQRVDYEMGVTERAKLRGENEWLRSVLDEGRIELRASIAAGEVEYAELLRRGVRLREIESKLTSAKAAVTRMREALESLRNIDVRFEAVTPAFDAGVRAGVKAACDVVLDRIDAALGKERNGT